MFLLPVELQQKVLFELLSTRSACAFSLFVPEWAICEHTADPVNEVYGIQRIDVYTKPMDGSRGRFESGSKHDHIFFPARTDLVSEAVLVKLRARFPGALECAEKDLERARLRCFQQQWPRDPDGDVGKCMAAGALVFTERNRWNSNSGSGTAFETRVPPRWLMFNGFPNAPWTQFGTRRHAMTASVLEMRVLVDRGAAMLQIKWEALTSLEMLFLDLRLYGQGRAAEDAIRAAATGMRCLRLECLVIAGLRSGQGYVRPRGWEMCDWEEDDKETDGEMNWVKVFHGAVRKGGRLIFLDRRMANVDWKAWRTRAEREGLLPDVDESLARKQGDTTYLGHVGRVLGQGDDR
ncbi:hypothetical protein CCHL11_02252 [Colletotrichum chlorophyti]|uniref:Uncharacterized protein n=1 Tax=Colletotrichum chlorophyti TaxID=708187 RepID=A0A1Q8S6D9_9PEZI|nr:hypothetical protein CCHL11_02252 [Colletotrichum chlorophyti]